MIDVRRIFPTTHVIDTDYHAQFCWAMRQLHTFRKTICGYKFTDTDRRLFGSTSTLSDYQLLETLPRCESCSVLIQFAIANKYVREYDNHGEPRYDLLSSRSFDLVREELEKCREG
jgi:hypothetical protein